MVQVARIIGGAGTGKTTELLRLMEILIREKGVDPFQIGFVSFTRAARHEAAVRAADAFNLKPEDLERSGWFRTLHSICYRQLGIGKELLTGNAESRKWLSSNLGEEVSGGFVSEDDTDLSDGAGEDATEADVALSIWEKARNTLASVDFIWREYIRTGIGVPTQPRCTEIIERYEQVKRIDHRCDFTDLLGRFAGIRFGIDHHDSTSPEGELPSAETWFLDEQQDTSALLDAVCRRLVEPARFAYLCLDPFQAIYGFAGSDARHAMSWEIQAGKERILPKSYRCPSEILSLGEKTLQQCSDYWDRGIEPREAGGSVEAREFGSWWENGIDPRESWLLIARTNFQAKRLAKRLQSEGIPWVPTRGNGGWKSCARTKAINALHALATGGAVTALEWRDVLKTLPSRVGDKEFLNRGIKSQWSKREADWSELIDLEHAGDWGASNSLIEHLGNGRWKNLIKDADIFVSALDRWGFEAVEAPKISVGTIHSVKGAEADNVVLLTTTSQRVETARDTQAGFDEEQRIAYVGVTRARQRLMILDERTPFRLGVAV